MISLEAPQPSGSGENERPWDFTEDGHPIWKEDESIEDLASTMRRIYEQTGDFSQVSRISVANGTAFKGKEKAEESDKSANDASTISIDKLVQLRVDMQNRLNDIDYALNSGLNLLNVMLAPLDPAAVDASALPLPSGSMRPIEYSIEHTPAQPDSIALVEGSLSLLHKQKALRDASQALLNSGKQLQAQVTSTDAEWETLLKLRENGWKLRPSGARPGLGRVSLVGKGSERAAREVGIAYGPVEAAQTLRASSLATFSHGDDSSQKLVLPSRARRRLLVKLALPDGVEHSFCPSTAELSGSIEGDLQNAREEAFEEEVFGEVARDARSNSDRQALVTDDAVVVQDLEGDTALTLEMIPAGSGPSTDGSPTARLVSAALRIILTANFSVRRASHNNSVRQPTQRPILSRVLDLLQYHVAASTLSAKLNAAAEVVRRAGLTAEVEEDICVQSPDALVAMMANSQARVECGGTATLRVAGRHRIDFLLSSPSTVSICLEHGPLPLSPQRLPSVLDDEICLRVSAGIAALARSYGGSLQIVKRQDHVLVRKGDDAFRFGIAVHTDAGLSITAVHIRRGSDEASSHVFPRAGLQEWIATLLGPAST